MIMSDSIIIPDKKIVPLNPKQTTDMRIGRTEQNVILQFGTPTLAVRLLPIEALEMAGLLIKHATAFLQQPVEGADNGEKKIELPG